MAKYGFFNILSDRFNDVPNNLHLYDNVEYHIEFFLTHEKVYKDYAKDLSKLYNQMYFNIVNDEKTINMEESEYNEYVNQKNDGQAIFETLLNYEKKLNRQKIIIAESGVTAETSILSLITNTYTPEHDVTHMMMTTDMELTIKEQNSFSLVNKIALISAICGYKSYVLSPYFISISFSGYDSLTGKRVEKIPLITTVNGTSLYTLTYPVIISKVTSYTEGSSTTHKFKLHSINNSIDSTEFSISEAGTVHLRYNNIVSVFNELQYKLNKKLKKIYPKEVVKNIYKDENIINISLYTNDAKPGVELTRPLDQDELLTRINTNSTQIYKLKENYEKSNYDRNTKKIEKIKIKTLEDKGISLFNEYKNKFYHKMLTISPSPNDTLLSFLLKVIQFYPSLVKQGYILVPKIQALYMGSNGEKNFYKYNVVITLEYNVGILSEFNRDNGEKSLSDYKDAYVLDLLKEHKLYKKYYWGFTGKNIDVLSVKQDNNNLWLLNHEITSKTYADNTSNGVNNASDDSVNKIETNEDIQLNNDDLVNGKYYMDDIINNASSISDIYDLYYKYTSLGEMPSVVENDLSDITISDNESNKNEKTAEDMELEAYVRKQQTNIKLGIENVFQGMGKRTKLELEIIGDPYWITGNSFVDTNEYGTSYRPHFLFEQHENMLVDERDVFKKDSLSIFKTIYTVTQIKSLFEGGRFTQSLIGVVPPLFLSADYINKPKNQNQRANDQVQLTPEQLTVVDQRVTHEIDNQIYGENTMVFYTGDSLQEW